MVRNAKERIAQSKRTRAGSITIHSWLATIGLNLNPPDECRVVFLWRNVFLFLFYFVFSKSRRLIKFIFIPRYILSTCSLYTNSGCGKERRILIGLMYGDLPRQHSFGTTLRSTAPMSADSRQ